MHEDGLETASSTEQRELERKIASEFYSHYEGIDFADVEPELRLTRRAHVEYLRKGLGTLPSGFVALDASRPWLCYWITHGLALLDALPDPAPATQRTQQHPQHDDEGSSGEGVGEEDEGLPPAQATAAADGTAANTTTSGTTTSSCRATACPMPAEVAAFLAACQHPGGGHGGGPQQQAHLAPTYAAVCCLVTLGGEEALKSLDRASLRAFLRRCCVPPARGGGIAMHVGGEVDVRGCYTALAAAHMAGLDKHALAERAGLVDFVSRCQTHEGGLGGEPGNEAHGGYTFCGVAALLLLGRADALQVPRLVHWLVHRQGEVEGGFNGRTNKLVDGCYSFWQGGVFPLLRCLGPSYALQIGLQAPPTPAPAPAAKGSSTLGGGSDDAKQPPPVVVRPPRLGHVLGPLQAANATLDAARKASREAAARAERATSSSSSPSSSSIPSSDAAAASASGSAAEEEEAVAAAQHAWEVAKQAEEHVAVTRASAALLCAGAPTTAPVVVAASDGGGDASGSGGGGGDGAGAAGMLLPMHLIYNARALQLWVLRCCQAPNGGLRDKPGKPPDYYHSCYCLSGLSAAQQYSGQVVGPAANLLRAADPLCNVREDRLQQALEYFAQHPLGEEEEEDNS